MLAVNPNLATHPNVMPASPFTQAGNVRRRPGHTYIGQGLSTISGGASNVDRRGVVPDSTFDIRYLEDEEDGSSRYIIPHIRIRKMFLKQYNEADTKMTKEAVESLAHEVLIFIVNQIIKAGVIASAAHRITIKYSDIQAVLSIRETGI